MRKLTGTLLVGTALLVASTVSGEASRLGQLTATPTSAPGPGALDDAGGVLFAGTSTNQFGGNPGNAFQLVRFDAVSGAGTLLTTRPEGVTALVSVSDDGQWLAFPSFADLTGQNHDGSVELFVMRADGSGLAQLTNDPAPNAGSVSAVVLSGSGNRVVFVANTDPLGGNPAHRSQVFVVDRSGANLRQLTAAPAGSPSSINISDDGARVVFAHDGNLTGADPDGGGEIFAILADGTGLQQITNCPAGFGADSPSLSGNGLSIAFGSSADLVGTNPSNYSEVFLVNFNGTGLRQVTRTTNLLSTPFSAGPSITDDGLTIFYYGNHSSLFVNFDGNYEIFRIKSDGTGIRALTSTLLLEVNLLPTAAGSGNRVAFYTLSSYAGGTNPDSSPELCVMDGNGGNRRQLTTTSPILLSSPAITPDGSRVVFLRNDRVLGNDEIWRVQADGSGLAAVTNLGSGVAGPPQVAGDGQTIVFASETNDTGANGDANGEIFLVAADGSGLTQLTSSAAGASANPAIAAASRRIAFESTADLAGGNADGSREIFVVEPDGSGLRQLTSGVADTASRLPRIDGAGTFVVFESNADLDGGNPDGGYEVWRARADGTAAPERLTGDPLRASRAPDISADGGSVAYVSSADPLGTNPEGNAEVFVRDLGTGIVRQLTSSATGSASGARLSGDGAFVFFASDAPYFETVPGDPSDLYRVPAAGGPVSRASGPRGPSLVGGAALALLGGGGGSAAPSHDGSRAVFAALGNGTGGNPDVLPEVLLADFVAPADIRVGRVIPTVLAWDPEPEALRYDAIRGTVAGLGPGTGGAVDLGPVACLENDSPDATTAGFGDPAGPGAGGAFYFLRRGSQGLGDPGSYGASSAGGRRLAGSGDCP